MPGSAEDDGLPPVAWGPVLAVGAVAFAVLLAVASRYGWHRDELYFLEAGKHLDWGYVDQPPFTPFVARVADTVAPGNLVVLRLLPAVATVVSTALAALIAREMGGRRPVQVLAAVAAAGGFALGVGHLLSTAVFDLTAWLALLWIFVRLLRTGDARLWLAFGAVAGLSLWNKDVLVLLGLSLLAGLALARRWDVLRSRWVAWGIAVAIVVGLPPLVWQVANGFPEVAMARALSGRLAIENRATLLPAVVFFCGALVLPILVRGVRWLCRGEGAVSFRPVVMAWLAAIAITFITAGRPYYVVPLTLVVVISGIVASEARGSLRSATWLIGIGAVATLPLALPVLPLSTLRDYPIAAANEAVNETVGWPEMVDQLAAVVHGLPADEQAHVVLLAESYGEAAAIDRFGPARGIGPGYSAHNGYWYFRRPTDDGATVVAVRIPVAQLAPHFESCSQVATVDNGYGIHNEVQGQPIVVCRGLHGSWAELWPRLKFLS